MKTTKMMLGCFLLAEFREADYNNREKEGYYAIIAGDTHFRFICKYEQSPKMALLELLQEQIRQFVAWKEV